ncbi:MAG TPA: DUF3764 family protein [Bacteroidia bacterium]|nr:DUF3764 family protein [Bacteroidia bacterium]
MKTLLIISHEVRNYDEWKKGFDAGAPMREQAGIQIQGVHRSVDNSNSVTIISEVPNADVAKAVMQNPELRADMEKSGVISEPEVKIVQ